MALADPLPDDRAEELAEWLDSVDGLIAARGSQTAEQILADVVAHARRRGVQIGGRTPYRNTLPTGSGPYLGDVAVEERIAAYLRWNAMAMVVRANKRHAGLGGRLPHHGVVGVLAVGHRTTWQRPRPGRTRRLRRPHQKGLRFLVET